MNILVYNPAALNGGAMRVLNSFIKDIAKDSENNYWFIVSNEAVDLLEIEVPSNVKMISINRSYIYRLKWLYYDINHFIELYRIDFIISLENVCNIILKKIPQYVYLHQSIQFAPTKVLNLKLFLKVKILNGLLIKLSSKHAKGVFVQTRWMKEALISNYNIKPSSIYVIPPELPNYNKSSEVNLDIVKLVSKHQKEGKYVGLCVTNANSYKRLETLLYFVAKSNKEKHIEKRICLLLTFSETQSRYAKKIKKLARKLGASDNIIFTGNLNANTIHYLYKKCDALFYSSAVETLGFPLIEAMSKGLRIFAPNLPYVKDVCNDYAFTYKFDDSNDLMNVFQKYQFEHPVSETPYKGLSFKNLINTIIDIC